MSVGKTKESQGGRKTREIEKTKESQGSPEKKEYRSYKKIDVENEMVTAMQIA